MMKIIISLPHSWNSRMDVVLYECVQQEYIYCVPESMEIFGKRAKAPTSANISMALLTRSKLPLKSPLKLSESWPIF